MKKHHVEQGTPEWHELRNRHLCASEAPAMMGESRFKSRNQLLKEKATGEVAPVSPALQRVFDRGHAAEAGARNIIELEMLEDFPPAVGTREVDGLSLLASFDGIGSVVFEHKLWNAALAENVRNGIITPEYYWQLEHQLLVSGLSDALFVVSDGTAENMVSCGYTSDPQRRKQLIAGWHRFVDDKASWRPTAKTEPVEGESGAFPLVVYHLEGSAIQSNIHNVLSAVKERAKEEMSRPLETDQDFADKEATTKAVKDARARLKLVVEQVRNEFVSFSEFATVASQIDDALQKMQSHGERVVKEAKDAKKRAIEQAAMAAFLEHLSVDLGGLDPQQVVRVRPDFQAAMKNKKTIESLQNAVDDELSRAKVEADLCLATATENLSWYRALPDYRFLFHDLAGLLSQPHQSFSAIVNQRISDHEKAEKARREREEAAAKTVHTAPPNKPLPQVVQREQPKILASCIEEWAQRHGVSDEALAELLEIVIQRAA